MMVTACDHLLWLVVLVFCLLTQPLCGDAFWDGIVSADSATLGHVALEGSPTNRVSLIKVERNQGFGVMLQEWRNFAEMIGSRATENVLCSSAMRGEKSAGQKDKQKSAFDHIYNPRKPGEVLKKERKNLKLLEKKRVQDLEEQQKRNPLGLHLLPVELNAQHEKWQDDKDRFNLEYVLEDFYGGTGYNPYLGDYYLFQPVLHLAMHRGAIRSHLPHSMRTSGSGSGSSSALLIVNMTSSFSSKWFVFSQLHIQWFVMSYAPGIISVDIPMHGTVPQLDLIAECFLHHEVDHCRELTGGGGDTSGSHHTENESRRQKDSHGTLLDHQTALLNKAKKMVKRLDLEEKKAGKIYIEAMKAIIASTAEAKGSSFVGQGMKAVETLKDRTMRDLFPTGRTKIVREISKGKTYENAVADVASAKGQQKGLIPTGSRRKELYHRMNALSRFKIIL